MHYRQFNKVLTAVAAAGVWVTAMTLPTQTFAQENSSSRDALEEITVTARKREESLQKVPVAITAFTGSQLQDAAIVSTRALFENTPGLNYDTGFDQNAGTPAIRGVVSSEIATYRQKITTFLDGMPILGQQGTVPFNAIQQVEVLRGPQSAAFGRSTFGGAINYITQDPGEDFEAEINLDIGSNSFVNINGLLAGPLIADTLGGLISVGHISRDGESDWVTVTEGYGLGGEESQNLLAKLVFTPGDSTTIEFRYKWLDVDNEQTPRAFMPLDDPARMWHPDAVIPPPFPDCGVGVPAPSCAIVGTVQPFNQVYDYNYALTGIDDPFVRNQRDRFELEWTNDFSNGMSFKALGFVSEEFYERAADMNLANDPGGFERDPTDIEETYAEVRLNSSDDQRIRWGVGASYYDYDFLTNIFRSRGAYDANTPNVVINETATNTGVFFNVTADITEELVLSLEGRYQSDDVGGTSDGTFELRQTTEGFLPRLALTYSPSDATTLYAQVSKGANPAGVNVGAINPNFLAGYEAFPQFFPPGIDPTDIAFYEEEEIISYEVGVKGSIGDRARYAINVYMLEWENYTQPFFVNYEPLDFVDDNPNDNIGDVGTPYEGLSFSGGRSFLGAGNVSGQGIEFEGDWLATDNFRIGFNATYMDMTYDNGACSTLPLDFGVPADTISAAGLPCASVAGKEIGTQPKYFGSLNLEYNLPLSNGMDWFTRWNTRFTASQYVTAMNVGEIDGYSISDLRTGLDAGNWRVEAYVTNLFDDDTPQGPQYFFDGRIPGPPPFVQNVSYTARRGQAFGARVSYRFGAQ